MIWLIQLCVKFLINIIALFIGESTLEPIKYKEFLAWDTVILTAMYTNSTFKTIMEIQYNMDRSNPNNHIVFTYNSCQITLKYNRYNVMKISQLILINIKNDVKITALNGYILNVTNKDNETFRELVSKLNQIIKIRGNKNDLKRIQLLMKKFECDNSFTKIN